MSSSKKIIGLLKDFAAGVYLSEAQNPIPPPPSYTLYLIWIQYTYSHREGGSGGRIEPERRGKGQQFTKLGRKYQNDLQSINSAKHSPVYKFC
jgi:hypothetical protein